MRAPAIALLLLCHAAAAGDVPRNAIQAQPEAMRWMPGGAAMPPGTQVVVLEGDPKGRGLFTQRVRLPAGTRIAPHRHPRDERVTVLSGSVAIGFGDVIDERAVTRFGPGSFYVNPAGSHHYVLVLERAEVQVTGEGPWELHFIK